MSGIPGGGGVGELILCSIFFNNSPEQLAVAYTLALGIGDLVDPPATMALADRPPVTAYVRYFGGGEDSPSSKYDRITLRADVGEQLSLLGERTYDASAADLEVLVLTAPKSGVTADETIAALTARLRENQEKGKPTLLIDASVGSYEGPETQALLENADFAGLLGYAGRYDYASIVGVGLSMALAMRSFTEPAGLKYSSLARILAFRPYSFSRWVSSSSGVCPMSWSADL